MTNRLTIVTGYFGAPIHAKAAQLARERGVELLSLDEEIVRRDGRSIKRLVMMNGEHGYRNLEYEVLKELAEMRLIAECHSNAHRYPVIKQWFLERYPEIAKFGLPKFEESQNEITATAEQPLKVA